MSARKRPFGESRMWLNGPREIRWGYVSCTTRDHGEIVGMRTWSICSSASSVTMVVPVEKRSSTCPLVD
jgi:hypothetical protein